jgi:amino acid permease
MHNSDLKVYVEEPFLKKGDSDDETVLSDESFYDPSANTPEPVDKEGCVGFIKDAFKAGSIKGGIFTLICSTLGKGMLMIPNAMGPSGIIWSVIQLALCALIAYFSLSTLTLAASGYRAYSYQRLAEISYGKKFKSFVNVSFFLTYWSAALAILVLISEFFSKIFETEGLPIDKYWNLIVATFLVYPLCLAKELKQLRYAYILSFFFVVIMTLVIVYQAFVFAEDGNEAHFMRNLADVDRWNFGGASSTFATAVFAYSCHPSALDVFKELYNPTQRRMEKVVRRTLLLTLLAYLLIGVFGYITFVHSLPILADHTKANGVILFGYGYDSLGRVLKYPTIIFAVIIMEAISLIILEPLTIKPAKDSLQSMIFGGKKGAPVSTFKHVLMATITLYTVVGASYVITNLAKLVNIIGASLLSSTCFVVPALFYLKLKEKDPMTPRKIGCHLMLWGSVIFGIYATYINVVDMINS